MNLKTLTPVLVSLLAAACADHATIDIKMQQNPNAPVEPVVKPVDPVDPTAPVEAVCDQGYNYQGFGGMRLEVGRDEDQVGFDRDRVKPLTALRGEYARVLGTTPALLDSLSNTFGVTPPRWYIEPESTAVSLYSSMRVAFVGCLGVTATADYDVAPDPTNARAKCGAFAHRFWSREANTEELDSCVELVTNKTGEEPAARRKWAYACASVLSSTSFLTY
ncbi:MAG: hypothetical protein H6Q89_5408 [Myxococcaceae bacterium]|nr:hypothetical protein [Myxococcaceae bacterium]